MVFGNGGLLMLSPERRAELGLQQQVDLTLLFLKNGFRGKSRVVGMGEADKLRSIGWVAVWRLRLPMIAGLRAQRLSDS